MNNQKTPLKETVSLKNNDVPQPSGEDFPLSNQVLLVILDGLGISSRTHKNAVHHASTPNLDELFTHYPSTTIESGGEFVGLPRGIRGNSEVGHMNIGAGRPVEQDLVRINRSIADQTLKDRPELIELIDYGHKHGGRLHLLILLSDGGVHSHLDHLKELLKIFKTYSPELKIYLHAFMDGRDTAQTDGMKYVQEILQLNLCKFASMQGRSFGMDRDRRWGKIETAYKTLTGQGPVSQKHPLDYLKNQYRQQIYDEFIPPVLFSAKAAIGKGEGIFFLNFRPDRAQQLSLAFCQKNFSPFPVNIQAGHFLCMTPYIKEEVKLPILFDKEKLSGTLCEYLSTLGHHQFKIAETEKYAHITYFFNGGENQPFPLEDRILISSPQDVATYDLKPEMSAHQVTTNLLQALEKNYKFLCVNYANCDMVGHTGNYQAAIKAVETVDWCLGELMKKCLQKKITLILTADHGNCDQMAHPDGSPHTAHSDAPVPFSLYHPDLKDASWKTDDGFYSLKDVAPTILACLGIAPPTRFTGQTIFPQMRRELT